MATETFIFYTYIYIYVYMDISHMNAQQSMSQCESKETLPQSQTYAPWKHTLPGNIRFRKTIDFRHVASRQMASEPIENAERSCSRNKKNAPEGIRQIKLKCSERGLTRQSSFSWFYFGTDKIRPRAKNYDNLKAEKQAPPLSNHRGEHSYRLPGAENFACFNTFF